MVIRKVYINNLDDAKKIVASSKCDEFVYTKLAKKLLQSSYIVNDIDNRAVNILKQDALSCGCDVAVSKEVSLFKKTKSTAVICANQSQIEKLLLKIKSQPFGLKQLAQKITDINSFKNKEIVCANKKILLNKPLVMGIINLSQDSFYGDGSSIDKAVQKAIQMQKDGADILDIGAESTRPNSKPVPIKEETYKIKSFLKAFIKKAKVPISIDTYKPEVANMALQEGADIINDIYALRYNNCKMAKVVSKHKAGIVLMHMQNTPSNMQRNIKYKDIILEVFEFLYNRINFALDSGINKNSIIIDPGIGFGKTVAHNLLIIKKLIEFKSLGMPLLVGVSNKSFLEIVIKDKKLENRLIPSIVSNVNAIINGADIVRVHNVKEMVNAVKIINSIRNI